MLQKSLTETEVYGAVEWPKHRKSVYVDQVYFGCRYCCVCIISSPPDHNFAVGYLVQVGLFYVVNDYLVVPTVSVDFMQPENVMVSQAVQCVARLE